MLCSHCKKNIQPDSKFCMYCGALQKKKELNYLCILGFVFAVTTLLIQNPYGLFSLSALFLNIASVLEIKQKRQQVLALGIAGIVISGIGLLKTCVFYLIKLLLNAIM